MSTVDRRILSRLNCQANRRLCKSNNHLMLFLSMKKPIALSSFTQNCVRAPLARVLSALPTPNTRTLCLNVFCHDIINRQNIPKLIRFGVLARTKIISHPQRSIDILSAMDYRLTNEPWRPIRLKDHRFKIHPNLLNLEFDYLQISCLDILKLYTPATYRQGLQLATSEIILFRNHQWLLWPSTKPS